MSSPSGFAERGDSYPERIAAFRRLLGEVRLTEDALKAKAKATMRWAEKLEEACLKRLAEMGYPEEEDWGRDAPNVSDGPEMPEVEAVRAQLDEARKIKLVSGETYDQLRTGYLPEDLKKGPAKPQDEEEPTGPLNPDVELGEPG